MQSLESQIFAFGVTVLMGLTVGILFDFYRVTKGAARPGKIASYAGDILFWVISTIVVFFMLLVGNWGEIRLYVIIGVATGAAVYIKVLSRFVTGFLRKVLDFIRKAMVNIFKFLSYVWFIVTYPITLVRNIIIIPIGYIGTILVRTRGILNRFFRKVCITTLVSFKNRIKLFVKKSLYSLIKKK